MNISKPVCLLLVALNISAASATDYEFVAGDQSHSTKICVAAANNDLHDLRRQISRLERIEVYTNQKIKLVARNQLCNNQNIVKFAKSVGADDSVKLMARYLNQDIVITRDLAKIKDSNGSEKKIIVVTGS